MRLLLPLVHNFQLYLGAVRQRAVADELALSRASGCIRMKLHTVGFRWSGIFQKAYRMFLLLSTSTVQYVLGLDIYPSVLIP
jgi:hypothetical protein